MYRPSKVPRVSSPPIYTANIENFRGVDFTNAPLNVELYRSPDALNVIAGADGFPVSRHGYEQVQKYADRINGMYKYGGETLVHHGKTMSKLGGADIATDLNDDFSSVIYWDGKLYLIDGANYRVIDDTGIHEIEPFIPKTTIGMQPDGSNGKPFQPVNMLTPKRENTFVPSSNTAVNWYVLDVKNIDSDPVVVYFDTSGGGREYKQEGTDFTVYRGNGQIMFNVAPPVLVEGRATVHIIFSKTVEGYADKVKKCTISTMFGAAGSANTVFLSGNPQYPNMIVYSAAGDPTYFPDVNYILAGQDASAVMGFTATGNGSLSVHKERTGVDPTIFYITGEITTVEGLLTPLYRIRQGAVGVGVVAKRSIASLGNDALFLSTTGVFADKPTGFTSNERYAQSRSYYANGKLTREPNLAAAEAISYKGYYYLAINGHVYVADGVHDKAYISNNQISQYEYEWYYWDNCPVRVWYEGFDGLYFGSADGAVYRFADLYTDNGVPIKVHWRSKLFDFGTITNLKTVKSVHVMPNPYTHSTINIDFIQAGISETVKETSVDIFDFNSIRFDRFSFETDPTPRIIPIRRRVKKLKTFQLRVWSDAGEPLGLFKIAIRYQIGGLIK